MYPYFNQPFGLPFGPFGFPFGGRRRRLNLISGIPTLRTTGVVANDTEVRFDLNPCEYNILPNEGLFFLDVRQTVPAASTALPVGLEEEGNQPQSLLLNALNESVLAGDLQNGIKYLVYYNKRSNVYQLVNAYPATITAGT